jgi:ribokinase
MKRIIVIGSSNTDMVIKSKKLPVPGETILGGAFLMNPGGKGANQAVAAARLGGNVTFVSKVGNDMFGSETIGLFNREKIDTSHIINDPANPSGVALIIVDENGENSIVVAPGSNGSLSAYDIDEEVLDSDQTDIFLMQLEIPVGTVEFVAQKAQLRNSMVILNPAPARYLSDDLLGCVSIITPNETEAELLTGIKVTDSTSAQKASEKFHQKGIKSVVITMGASGAFISSGSISKMISVVPVKAVDTTAAGDIFHGALAVSLSEGKGLEEAVVYANKASAISVTRMGAQASAPYRNELI